VFWLEAAISRFWTERKSGEVKCVLARSGNKPVLDRTEIRRSQMCSG